MDFRNYFPSQNGCWNGRIDDLKDATAFRIHQVVSLINLREIITGELDNSKLNICFLGFCCDEGIERNLGRTGAVNGPEYIRSELANLPVNFGEHVALYDAGDIACKGNKLEEAQEDLENAIKILLANKLFPIVLGGGHELALGHYKGIASYLDERNEKDNLGIINFDAHFDLRPFKSKGSSGTMFSQIANLCKEENKPFNYMCLGVQTYANTTNLFNKAEELGVEYILAKDFVESNFNKISQQIADFTKKHKKIYLTLCSDVFNSAYAPGVSSLQPFGMNPEVVLSFLKEVFATQTVVAFDVAEVSPRFDQDKRTAKLVAVIIYAAINTLATVLLTNRNEI